MNKEKISQRLNELRAAGIQYREATTGAIDVEARTVELSFSSETEKVARWYGIEILDHTAGAVDLSRLNNKAAVLWNHDWDDQRGVVESARIDADRIGRATVRFSRSAEGEKLFQDIIDGIVTKVSVGYLADGMKFIEERDGVDVFLITSWQPYEISLVSVPADDDVGVGRSAEKPQEEATGNTVENANVEVVNTSEQPNLIKGHEIMSETTPAANAINAQAERQAGADVERTRVRELTELGKAYGATDKAMDFIAEGKTAEDLRRVLLDDYAKSRSAKPLADQEKGANIGLGDKEVRQFSIMKAIRAMAEPRNKAAQEAAAFEFEASRAAAELYGKDPKGIIIPNDVLSRAFSTSNPGAGPGSNLVANDLLSGSFIELLRKKAWVMRRARTLSGLVGNVDIPRQNASGSAYWVGEGGGPTEGSMGVDQIAFTPKTVGAYTDITRRLMMQSTPDAEALVRDDLLKIIGLEIDRVAIYGTGTSNQPKGVKNFTGINAVDFAAANPTFAEVVAMETAIALDDADVDNMSYAFNATMRGHFKTAPKFGSGTEATIWEPGKTVNGYDTNVSNQVAAGDAFFANWQDLVIAMWGGLELTVDPYALSTSGGLRLVALQDIDINLRHLESFCWGSAAVTA